MKVMLRVRAQFHAAYGFSWIVSDINPEYTMGDLARRRQEIVRQLKAEGVFDLQKELRLPLFAQRIAVISSEGAAGYGDFSRQLHDNQGGYIYKVELFAAVMQGEAVEQSVIAALGRIYERVDDFDAVVVIRGGGATSDMSGFDTLALAENVANFPLPVITGIGHERDECVLDMVAFARMKTPTAAAQFLIDNLQRTALRLDQLADRIADRVQRRMDVERVRLVSLSERIPMLFSLVKTKEWGRADRLMQRITTAANRQLVTAETYVNTLQRSIEMSVRRKIDNERYRLELLAQRVEAENPDRLLRRGYSITTYNGKAVRDAAQLPQGALVETHVEKGTFKSRVE
jgi:exodeoxyribonuclease VII large subunit